MTMLPKFQVVRMRMITHQCQQDPDVSKTAGKELCVFQNRGKDHREPGRHKTRVVKSSDGHVPVQDETDDLCTSAETPRLSQY